MSQYCLTKHRPAFYGGPASAPKHGLDSFSRRVWRKRNNREEKCLRDGGQFVHLTGPPSVWPIGGQEIWNVSGLASSGSRYARRYLKVAGPISIPNRVSRNRAYRRVACRHQAGVERAATTGMVAMLHKNVSGSYLNVPGPISIPIVMTSSTGRPVRRACSRQASLFGASNSQNECLPSAVRWLRIHSTPGIATLARLPRESRSGRAGRLAASVPGS